MDLRMETSQAVSVLQPFRHPKPGLIIMNKAEELKEKFCPHHGLSKEAIQENVLDCHAHLAEARVFICRYKSIDEARDKCVDYQLTQ